VGGIAVVVGVANDVVLLAAVLRQLMNLLSEAFVEVPALLPVEEADVPPNGMVLVVPVVEVPLVLVLLLCVFVFAANVEVVRLPAVTSAIAMTIAKIANAVDVFICIDKC
jgi:hypothetical protein